MTVSFTLGQLLGVVGAICLSALTIYLVGLMKELKKTARQLNETLYHVNEMIDDIQTTKMVVINKVAEFKKATDLIQKFKAVKEKRARKQEKKNKKQKEG
ncbi:MAG: hypothetical protein FWG67_09250 [Defluviitaleaceae bacterium]|nr:hypothetical protein [Defluviitaleaceae bacterium]